MAPRKTLAASIATVAAALLMAGCSSGTGTPKDEVVHLTFQAWDQGTEKVVAQWNRENPKIQVKLIKPSGTSATIHSKYVTNNKAGTNPDLIEVEYQSYPAMVANNVIASLDNYIPDIKGSFSPSSLAQVTFNGKTYGIPQQTSPMLFFYREDIFTSLGLTPPKTWDEYAQDAQLIHEKDPSMYIGNFDSANGGWFAGLAQQAGADWWKVDGKTWHVGIDDAATKKVASYWQGLIEKGYVSTEPSFSAQFNTDINTGKIVGWAVGQWIPVGFPSIAPDTKGKWKAVPLPAWSAGDQTVGMWGGSSDAVSTNSKHPTEAAKFTYWMNGTKAGMESVIKNVGVYPALKSAQKLPILTTPPSFMSNQPSYYADVAKASGHVRSFSIWGPNSNTTFTSYTDAFSQALQNKTSLVDAVDQVQQATVADMKRLGFKVAQ